MRKLRIAVIASVAGGVPVLLATMLDACGGEVDPPEGTATLDGRASDSRSPSFDPDTSRPPPPPPPECLSGEIRTVDLPDAGDAATPEMLCAVQPSPATTIAARVTLTDFSQQQKTAKGFLAVPADLEPTILGTPVIAQLVPGSEHPFALDVTNVKKVAGGFEFAASWDAFPYCNQAIEIGATFEIACADGGTKIVQSRTRLDLCDGADGGLDWVSSGDQCCDCQIIAEMAPSPIVSDKKKDDLPLARVVRLRVLELARAGRQVLLFAENDAGADLEIEWSVSAGSLERVAPDVMVWTLPDDSDVPPFGQVAIWNDAGAAVENFVWGTA